MAKRKTPKIVSMQQPPLKETRADALNRLFRENGLVEEDVYKDKTRKYVIMTRTGIDKIVARRGIRIQFEIKYFSYGQEGFKDCCVVMGTGKLGDRVVQETGESNADNLSPFNQKYPVAMAFKRAKSRVVLQLTGFYEQGVYGDEEEKDLWK